MTTFNAHDYWLAIAHDGKAKKSERPVTLANHEEAERVARQYLADRLADGCEDDTVPELSELYVEDAERGENSTLDLGDRVYLIADYGRDITSETEAWARIAEDLLAFRRKQTKGRKKAA